MYGLGQGCLVWSRLIALWQYIIIKVIEEAQAPGILIGLLIEKSIGDAMSLRRCKNMSIAAGCVTFRILI